MNKVKILVGNCAEVLKTLPRNYFNCCVTSPPYFSLRDYEMEDQVGMESTPKEYVDKLVEIFREVRETLRDNGTLWLNLGDTYAAQRSGTHMPAQTLSNGNHRGTGGTKRRPAHRNASAIGLKHKDLIGIPWKVAFALQEDGWYLRQDIIWSKPNPMPESIKDRCTKSHEYIFLLSKSEKYYFNYEAIREPTVSGGDLKNKRSVWTVPTRSSGVEHYATYPEELVTSCIAAGSPMGGFVLDPFAGSGTTGIVAQNLCCDATLIELNPEFAEIARKRVSNGLTSLMV